MGKSAEWRSEGLGGISPIDERLGIFVDALEAQIRRGVMVEGNVFGPAQSDSNLHASPPSLALFLDLPLYVAYLHKRGDDYEEPETYWGQDDHEVGFDERSSERTRGSSGRSLVGIAKLVSHVSRPGVRTLTGGPGTGKSFVSWSCTLEIIRRWRSTQSTLPILCSAALLLRNLPSNLLPEGEYNDDRDAHPFAEALVKACSEYCKFEIEEGTRNELVRQLVHGGAVGVVDALDEVPGHYVFLGDLLKEFASRQHRKVLVTGRAHATSRLTPSNEWSLQFETAPWRPHQIRGYGRCYGLDEACTTALISLAFDQGKVEIGVTPQLLAFCAELLITKLITPQNLEQLTLVELFEAIVSLRLQIGLGETDEHQIKQSIQELSQSALRIWDPYHNSHIGTVSGLTLPDRLIEILIASGLLTRHDRLADDLSELGWAHRDILEYFVGRGAGEHVLQNQEDLNQLASWAFHVENHQVLRFAYGWLLQRAPDLAGQLLSTLGDARLDDEGRTRLAAASLLCCDAPIGDIASSVSCDSRWAYGQASARGTGPVETRVSHWSGQAWSADPRHVHALIDPLHVPSWLQHHVRVLQELSAGQGATMGVSMFLSDVGDRTVAPGLVKAIELATGDYKHISIEDIAAALARLGDSSATPAISRLVIAAIHACDWYHAKWLSSALGRLGDVSAVPVLIQLVEAAALADDTPVEAPWGGLMSNGQWDAVHLATRVLQHLRVRAAEPSLRLALDGAIKGENWEEVGFLVGCLWRSGGTPTPGSLDRAIKAAHDAGQWSTELFLCTFMYWPFEDRLFDRLEEFKGILMNSHTHYGHGDSPCRLARTLAALEFAPIASAQSCTNLTVESPEDVGVSNAIARVGGGLGDSSIASELVAWLGESVSALKWEEAVTAVSELAELGVPSAFEAISNAVETASRAGEWVQVRELWQTLADVGDLRSVPILTRVLWTASELGDAHLVYGPVSALTQLRDSSAVPALQHALATFLNAGDWTISDRIAECLGVLGDSAAAVALQHALDSAAQQREWGAAVTMTKALRRLGDSPHNLIEAVDEAVRSGDWLTVRQIASKLGPRNRTELKLLEPELRHILATATGAEDWEVVKQMLWSLVDLGDTDALAELHKVVTGSSSEQTLAFDGRGANVKPGPVNMDYESIAAFWPELEHIRKQDPAPLNEGIDNGDRPLHDEVEGSWETELLSAFFDQTDSSKLPEIQSDTEADQETYSPPPTLYGTLDRVFERASILGQVGIVQEAMKYPDSLWCHAPGLRFRTCARLVRTVPAGKPRHLINGTFVATADLVFAFNHVDQTAE